MQSISQIEENLKFVMEEGFAQKVQLYCDFLGKRRFCPKSRFN